MEAKSDWLRKELEALDMARAQLMEEVELARTLRAKIARDFGEAEGDGDEEEEDSSGKV